MSKKRKGKPYKAATATVKAFKRLDAANFAIEIPMQIYSKIMYWVKAAKHKECSGFGTVVYDKGTFTVEDAFMLKQTNQSTHTEIEAESLGKLEYKVHQNNLKGELMWWWHSHVQMPCHWSTTDMDTIRELGYNGWITATVFNQKYEHRSAFMQKINILGQDHEIFLDDLTTTFPYIYQQSEQDIWAAEFKENVVEKAVVVYGRGYGHHRNNHQPYLGQGNFYPTNVANYGPPVYVPRKNESLVSISGNWAYLEGHYAYMKQKGKTVLTQVFTQGRWVHKDRMSFSDDHYIFMNIELYPELLSTNGKAEVDTFSAEAVADANAIDDHPFGQDNHKTFGEQVADNDFEGVIYP